MPNEVKVELTMDHPNSKSGRLSPLVTIAFLVIPLAVPSPGWARSHHCPASANEIEHKAIEIEQDVRAVVRDVKSTLVNTPADNETCFSPDEPDLNPDNPNPMAKPMGIYTAIPALRWSP